MGDGFIDFCNTYYGGVWSVECARAYSEKMGGGSTYGNPNYIEQFCAAIRSVRFRERIQEV